MFLENVVKRYTRGSQTVEMLHRLTLEARGGEAGERLDRLSGGPPARWRARHAGLAWMPAALILGTLLGLCPGLLPAQDSPPQAVQEIQVVSSPGPAMWKVTRGDHELWILGTLDTLPKKMQWRSRDVEGVLGEAQEVVPFDFDVKTDIGFFSGVRLVFQYLSIRKLKNGQTLKQVVPADLYEHFSALRARYGGGPKDMEGLQPLFAVSSLAEKAIAKAGLASTDIQSQVVKLAKKHRVKIVKPRLDVMDPRGMLQEVGNLSIEQQLKCFGPALESLEQDLQTTTRRAAAWAAGDVTALRALAPPPDLTQACMDSLGGAPRARALLIQTHQSWMDTVNGALARNKVTLAVADFDDLDDNWVAEFKNAGYAIEGPEFSGPVLQPFWTPRPGAQP